MRRAIPILAIMALAACSTAPPPEAAPQPPVAPTPPPAPHSAPQPTVDSCGAAGLQHLVGRPRSEIPVPVKPELQRVACTTCPVTMDFNPNRLNIFFDAGTGLIKEVRCG